MKSSYLPLHFDEDVSVKIADSLRLRGFDVQTTQEAKNLSDTDKEQLDYAARTLRVLVTHNIKHFTVLHKNYISDNKSHPGVILVVRRKDPKDIALRLLHLLQTTSTEEMRGQIRYI